MNHLQLNEAALPDLSEGQISRLAKDELAHFSGSVEQLQRWSEQMRARINRAMEIRYAEQLGRSSDRSLCIDDGDLQIEMNQPTEVLWDQRHLSEIADRMVAAGDRVQDFMQIQLSVAEADYARWHPMLKAAFEPARQVRLGEPQFCIRWAGSTQLSSPP
jgi:hypothetical protein